MYIWTGQPAWTGLVTQCLRTRQYERKAALLTLAMRHSRTDEYVNGAFRRESITVNLANVRRWGGYGPIKRAINQFGIDLVAGRVNSCPHLRGAGIVVVALAHPRRMYCSDCARDQLFPRLRDPRSSRECDACGRPAMALHETTLNLGSVILFGNVCCDCNTSRLSQRAG